MKNAWLLLGFLISGCYSVPEPLAYQATEISHLAMSSAYFEGSDPVSITQLSGEALDRQFTRLSVTEKQKNQFSIWWLVLGPMQSSGGWSFKDSLRKDRIELCLLGPKPGAIVTMAFQAPMSLIGTNSRTPPIYTGTCPE